MTFKSLDGSRPIEELYLPFDPTLVVDKVQRRRRGVRSRLVSLVITIAILTALYFWQRDEMAGSGFVAIYAVVLGISVAWLLAYLVAYLLARRELRQVGMGTALRIGRPGVEIRGTFVPWPEVQSLAAVKGKMGRSADLELTRVNGEKFRVPLDQMQVRPATLDLTARAYSAGRHGVDLAALES
jgi:hypothetical protein